MTRVILFALAIVATLPSSQLSAPADALSDQIIAMERGALDRWGRGDPQGYISLYAADLTYFDPAQDRRLDGLEAMRQYVAPITGKVKIDQYEMIHPQVQHSGDFAVLTFNLEDEATPPNGGPKHTVRWNSTEVYRRIGGNWKIIHSHWSYTKPPR